MYRKRYVIIRLIGVSVAVPSVLTVKAVALLNTELESVGIVFCTNVLKSEVYEHREQLPVVAAKNIAVDLVKPSVEVFLLLVCEGIPDLIGRKNKRKTERRHLNDPLIVRHVGKISPILVALRVCSAYDALTVYLVKLAC